MVLLIKLRNSFIFTLISSGYLLTSSSCGSIKQLTYLQGPFDTAKLSKIKAPEQVIRSGDLISIIVFSDNPEATKIYNQSLISASSSGSIADQSITGDVRGTAPSAQGYEVDQKGNIVFQGVGLLHVEGLTRSQLKDTLDFRLRDYLKNSYYSIRFLNYKFTILGEVGRPGIVNIPGERVNMIQALALAGDMTFYGRRDNILVIRENHGEREFARLDITKPEIMASPYFYLQQNDVVIVEATQKKVSASDVVVARNITIALAAISTFAVLYSIFHHP